MDPIIALLNETHEWDHLDEDFREFLDIAQGFMAAGLCQVWALVRSDPVRVAGYYASAANCIRHGSVAPADREGYSCNPLPTIVLSQLARCGSAVQDEVDSRLLVHFLEQAAAVSRSIGVFAVELVAFDGTIAQYFEDLGFRRVSNRTPTGRVRLYLRMVDVWAGFQLANANTSPPSE